MKEAPEKKFHLKHFKAISLAISSYEDLTLLISHIAEGLTRTFKIKGCCIMLLDERERRLIPVGSYGVSEEYVRKGPLLVEDKDASLVAGRPVFIEDMQTDPRIQYPDAAARENIAALFSFPMAYRGATLGVIRLYHGEAMALHEEDVDTISVMAQHLGLVIENNGLKNFLSEVKSAMQNLPLRLLNGLTP